MSTKPMAEWSTIASHLGEPVIVLRDRNVRAWVALLIGALVLICIALVDLYAAEPRPYIAPSVTGSAE